jgi:hypothetical protein
VAEAGRVGAGRLGRTALRVAFGLAALALALVGAEFGLRWLDLWFPPAPLRVPWRGAKEDPLLRSGAHPCRLDPLVLWSPRPGARLAPGPDVRANELGGLGELPPRERTPGTLRIALLGDGHLAGLGLAVEQGLAARLGAALQPLGKPLEFVDAAIDETTLVQGRALYAARVSAWSPDLVVLCFPGRVECTPARGATDAAKLAALDAWTGGTATLGFELRLAHLARLAAAALDGAWIESRESGFVQAQREVALAAGYGAFAWKGVRRVPLDAYRAAYEQFALEIQRGGAVCVVLSVPVAPATQPPLPIVEGYARAAFEAAKASGATFVDARHALLAPGGGAGSGTGTAAAESWSAEAGRLSAVGHARAAAALAPALAPLLAKIAAERGS